MRNQAEDGDDVLDIKAAPDPVTATPEQIWKYNNRSVERVITVLSLLQEAAEPMSLADVHRSIPLAKATVFRYLWALERHRYVERDAAGAYRLGVGLVGLRSQDLDVLKEWARPWLAKLRDETGETVNLGVLDGNTVRYVEAAESPRRVRVAGASGDRDPLYCTALGKAIASQLPEARARELLEQTDMQPRTPSTITSLRDILNELDQVRQHCRSVDDCENEEDGRCVAVGIPGSQLTAALSLSAPAARLPLKDVPRIAKMLAVAAAQFVGDPQAVHRTALWHAPSFFKRR